MQLLTKIKLNILFCLSYVAIKRLESELSNTFLDTKFNKSKTATKFFLKIDIDGYKDALDYAFFRTYGFWGTDALAEDEVSLFNRWIIPYLIIKKILNPKKNIK